MLCSFEQVLIWMNNNDQLKQQIEVQCSLDMPVGAGDLNASAGFRKDDGCMDGADLRNMRPNRYACQQENRKRHIAQ